VFLDCDQTWPDKPLPYGTSLPSQKLIVFAAIHSAIIQMVTESVFQYMKKTAIRPDGHVIARVLSRSQLRV
jgi:hypothetical protein